MPLKLFIITLTSALLAVMAAGGPALAQKAGGILKLSHRDSPASMSILEESTGATLQPMMGVFNNLVMYDQHIATVPVVWTASGEE
jgi:peptide/nickel transport system substrate-binding protein